MLNAKFSEIEEIMYIQKAKNNALYFEVKSDFSLKKDQVLTNIRYKKVEKDEYKNVIYLYKITGFGDSYYKDFASEDKYRRVYIESVGSPKIEESLR
jgi:hypothetical protein